MTTYLAHRGLDAPTFAAALVAPDPPGFKEIFVTYEGIGTARIQRVYASSAPFAFAGYAVSLNGTPLGTFQTLTLSQLDTLVSFTAEPPTVAEQIADLETRVAALEAP